MIKEVKLTGLATAFSDYDNSDGSLAISLNSIYEDGALRPIAMPDEVFKIPDDYVLLIIHRTSTGDRYVFSKNGAFYTFTPPEAPAEPFFILASSVDYIGIDAIGNTLCILTSNGVYYILANDEGYKVLGNHLPRITLGCKLEGRDVWGDTEQFPFPEDETLKAGHTLTENNSRSVTEAVMGFVNKFMQEQANQKGMFAQPFFVRMALRLYDGSLVMHTPPVFMQPVIGQNPVVTINDAGGHNFSCLLKGMVGALQVTCRCDDSFKAEIEKWADIVRSIDVFVSSPIYTYDQNGKIEKFAAYTDRWHPSKCYSTIELTPDASSYPELQSLSRLQRLDKTLGAMGGFVLELPAVKEDEWIKNIRDCSTFYLLKSIQIEDIPSDIFTPYKIELPKEYLGSLPAHEALVDDFDSHDVIIPKFAFVYNSRLNLANINKRIGAYVDQYPTWQYVDHPTGNVPGNVTPYIYIKTDGVRTIIKGEKFYLPESTPLPYIYHPYSGVYKLLLVRSVTGTSDVVASFDLSPHNLLNGSVYSPEKYYEVPDAATPVWRYPSPGEIPDDADVVAYASVDMSGKIYTSQVNNPFSFPVTGINTVGAGEIKGISSAAKALSQGQFGQFPLYAFTTEGIWALEVSSSGTYIAKQPITRDVCLSSESITQIDNAVLFTTRRGIMLIQGSHTDCISDVINTCSPFDLHTLNGINCLHNLLNHDLLSDNCLDIVPFTEFLEKCRLLYDYPHQHIIAYSPLHSYAYAFSLRSKSWGMMYSTIKYGVMSYPDALAVDGESKLLNFSTNKHDAVDSLVVTNPLSLGAPDTLKTISTAILRGDFSDESIKGVILYGSRDLRSWHTIWSSKDRYLRGFRGTPYKFYRVAFASSLAERESLSAVTIQFLQKYTDVVR